MTTISTNRIISVGMPQILLRTIAVNDASIV